jgi:hypothetical protein
MTMADRRRQTIGFIGDGVWIQVVSVIVFAAFMPWLLLMGLQVADFGFRISDLPRIFAETFRL